MLLRCDGNPRAENVERGPGERRIYAVEEDLEKNVRVDQREKGSSG